MFNDTVTLYNKSADDRYTRRVLRGVYWLLTDGYDAAVQRRGDTVTVIIPTPVLGGASVAPGDLIVKGEAPEINRARDLTGFDIKVVDSVLQAQLRSPLAHIEVTAK